MSFVYPNLNETDCGNNTNNTRAVAFCTGEVTGEGACNFTTAGPTAMLLTGGDSSSMTWLWYTLGGVAAVVVIGVIVYCVMKGKGGSESDENYEGMGDDN